MKTWNDPGGSRRRLVSVAGAALILAGGVAVLRAFNPQPDPPKVFGILGITAADVIRLNVTNVAPDLGLIPPPCRIRFGFVNAAGAVLKSADVSVASGHSARADHARSLARAIVTGTSPFLKSKFSPEPEISSMEQGLALREQREDARRLVLPDGIGEDIKVLVQGRGVPEEGWTFQRKLF